MSGSGVDRIQVQTQDAKQPGSGEFNHSHKQKVLNTKHSTEG